MTRQAYDRLFVRAPAAERDPLVVEVVFAEPLAETELRDRVAAALPGVRFGARAVFEPGGDRYHFVEFPEIDPRGQEREAFAFGRELRPALGAEEVNPVLPDSLYGAAHVTGEPGVESAIVSCETPRNSTLPFGWHHPRIRTPEAWAATRGSGTTVAVIDTGYSSHQELRGAIRQQGQANFVEGGRDASDRFSGGFLTNPGHGTLVMSVVASRGTANAVGQTGRPGAVTGTAPEAEVLPIRAIQSVVDFTQRQIAPAIMHAIARQADVIVMALGGPTRVASTEQALRHAAASGVVVVCAAGNCWPAVVFPAAYAQMGICTAVAALQPDLRPWARTGRGPEVTIAAFGEHVWGAAKNAPSDPDGGIRASQGTTLATSITAGVAALWVTHHGGRAALLAKARAAGTTVQAMWVHCLTRGLVKPPVWGGANDLGAGVLDAKRVLDAPLPAGSEAPPAPREAAEPTINVLLMHLAGRNEAAVAEVTPGLAPFAPELIWLSYRAGARRRMVESGLEAAVRADAPSDALAAALAEAPALKALIGAD